MRGSVRQPPKAKSCGAAAKVTPSAVPEVCPWFPNEGTIDERVWRRVGDALQDFYKTLGPGRVPDSAFFHWNAIQDLLAVRHCSKATARVIARGEEALQAGSRPPSAALAPPREGEPMSPTTDSEPETAKTKTKRLEAFDRSSECSKRGGSTSESNSGESDSEGISAPLPTNHLSPPHAPSAPPEDPNSDLRLRLAQPRDCVALHSQCRHLSSRLVSPPPTGASRNQSRLRTALTKRLSSKPAPASAFPVIEVTSSDDEGSQASEGGGASCKWGPFHSCCHLAFKLKDLKELKTAASTYGPTAPYTLSVLDSLTNNWLTPNGWTTLTRVALSPGDALLWRAEYEVFCKDAAARNRETGQNDTRDMFLGTGDYESTLEQAEYPASLYDQIHMAALKAWHRLPTKGQPLTSITSVRQNPEEPFSDYVGRLRVAAEHLFGEATDSDFLKQLAFENAIPACQDALHPHKTSESLSGYIRLCADVLPAKQQAQVFAAALQNQGEVLAAALRSVFTANLPAQNRPPRSCFGCGAPDHRCIVARVAPLPSPLVPLPLWQEGPSLLAHLIIALDAAGVGTGPRVLVKNGC
nr:endogenous retrovirus group K member 6 Gag polyprotein-like [Dasypus novemcinctus]